MYFYLRNNQLAVCALPTVQGLLEDYDSFTNGLNGGNNKQCK